MGVGGSCTGRILVIFRLYTTDTKPNIQQALALKVARISGFSGFLETA